MTDILTYFFHSSIVFSVLYLVFCLFLQKLTFHHVNRLVLLAIIPLALGLPWIQEFFPLITLSYADAELPTFGDQVLHISSAPQTIPLSVNTTFNPIPYLFGIYTLGMLWHSLRLIKSLYHVKRLRGNSEMISKEGVQIFLADVPTIFSCFNWIFVPKTTQEAYNSKIIAHEMVHIRLKHSRDLLLSEFYTILFWFNPFIYPFKKSLKAIHEFQADHAVLQQIDDKIGYLTLLKTHISTAHTTTLYSNFHQPIIKKRIDMITKKNSATIHILRYGILLPLLLFFVMAFRAEPEKIVLPSAIEILSFDPISYDGLFFSAEPSFVFPIENTTPKNITAVFGKRIKHPTKKNRMFHSGIDIRATRGTPIIAAADGRVTHAALKGDWGNLIVIRHADGYETLYAHLKGFNVKKDQEIPKGAIIGYVGNTGASLGPHLHFEIRQNEKAVNPMTFFKE